MSDSCSFYEIPLDDLLRSVEQGVKRVLLHAPDGLKTLYQCIARVLVEKSVEVFFSASPGYGACDIPIDEAEALGVDLVVHLGHARYFYQGFKPSINILYLPVYIRPSMNHRALSELEEALRRIGATSVSVSSTIIEEKVRNSIVGYLEAKGFKPVEVEAPILGCLYSHVLVLDDSVDAHLVVAGGVFHPLGLALVSKRPVVVFDPYKESTWMASEEASRVLRRRLMRIFEARNSGNRVGIIIGARVGQYRPWLVERLEALAKESGYTTHRVITAYLNTDRLIAIDNALGLDIYVVTSCPRLPIDDLGDFYKPVLTPGEFIMLLTGLDRYVYPW